jgi:hypothetical protein
VGGGYENSELEKRRRGGEEKKRGVESSGSVRLP